MNAQQYWRERERNKNRLLNEEQLNNEVRRIHEEMRDEIQKLIDGFYGKYAKAEGISLAEAKKRASKLDIEAYARRAKKYVKEKDFTDRANEEMRLYNLTMKVNRLELLKAQIGLELCSGFSELEQTAEGALSDAAMEEFQRQAGILGETIRMNAKQVKQIVNASFHNATFSDRIWMYQDMLKTEIGHLLLEGIVQGRNSAQLATHLRKRFGVSQSDAERLMITEMTRVYTAAQEASFKEYGYEEYEFIAEDDARTCSICSQMDGKHFKVDEMMPGENAPPMHPRCRCSVAAYVGRAEIESGQPDTDGDFSFDKLYHDRARTIKTEGELRKITKSSIINFNNHEDIIQYFRDKYAIEISGFENKNLFKTKVVLAGYDDFLKEFPEIVGRINKIEYNSHLRSYGRMHRNGLSEVGPLGLGDYGTGIHEPTHMLDYHRSLPATNSYSEGVVEQARKNLHLRANSKDYIDMIIRITGSVEDMSKAYEVMAYALETVKAGPDNALANEIYRLIKEG